MTDKRQPTMSSPCNSSCSRGTLAALVATSTLILSTASAADDPKQRTLHVIDSSHDRTPSVTAIPTYPSVARRDRIEGDATVCYKVDVKGRIRSVRVKDYSARIFRRPALRAIKESTYEPLLPNEVLSQARTCRTYRFRLEPIVVAATDKK